MLCMDQFATSEAILVDDPLFASDGVALDRPFSESLW
jgi:hypothetical protein